MIAGLYIVIARENLIKKLVGLNVFQASVFILYITMGKVDGGTAPTVSASWYATENFAVELWGAADKFNHRVRQDGAGKIGTVEQQPVALSGQWHFGQADNVFRPFIGVGYYESNFSNEDIAGGGDHVGLTDAKGAIGTLGMDFNINPTWFARTDVRYVQSFEGARSSTSAIIVDDKGERLIVGQRDAGMPSDTSWLPLERVKEADVVLGDLRWLEGVRTVFAMAA